MEFFATCATGLEALLAGELRDLGLREVRPLQGQVSFAGPLDGALRACLWSRIASRVVAVLARVPARTSDELYAGVYDIAWEGQLPPGATLAVAARGTNAALRNTRFTALRTKDAIADRLADECGARLVTDPADPDLTVRVRLGRDRAVVGIDLAGAPLIWRDGRRQDVQWGRDALRPDYAAALLAASGWGAQAGEPTALFAFGLGAETIVEEARAQAAGRAPNLLRARWGFESWARHDADAWDALLDEADARAEQGEHATDGLRCEALAAADGQAWDAGPVCLCCSLLSSRAEDARAAELASDARALASRLPASSRLVVLASDDALGQRLGLAPTMRAQTRLGTADGLLCAYELGAPACAATVTLRSGAVVPVALPASEQFARRLEKNVRLRRRWARREGVSCYRLFDADLPDYAVAIDRFEASSQGDAGGPWLVVSEYAAPREVDPTRARLRLEDACTIAGEVCGVRAEDVFVRQRSRSRGGSQYADAGGVGGTGRPRGAVGTGRAGRSGRAIATSAAHLVDEGGLCFEVRFDAALDVGLFLDTRDVRSLVREQVRAAGESARFLNLFAYTGSATCYAADGGAARTTTVDLSRTYLDIARANMARNGFGGTAHEFVQADVLAWLDGAVASGRAWDVVYLDPPTFSNSARMREASFEIQRDHVSLLARTAALLAPGGVCVFCCNLRGFAPDASALAEGGVSLEDVTAQTIPADFSRNVRIHHCYLVRRA